MAKNKVVFGDEVLMDLTADTVKPDKMLKGVTAHDMSGEPIVGTCEYDVASGDATMQVAELLAGKTGYARGVKLTGTMPNRGAADGNIENRDDTYTIQQGYHDGSGKVGIDPDERAKIIPGNIKQGVKVLGVLGELEPSENVKAQAKTVIPKTVKQTVIPDPGIDYLSQVVVNPIPYVESENSAGGITVTIAGE